VGSGKVRVPSHVRISASGQVYTLHPAPYTLHPTLQTLALNPTPTLHPTPYLILGGAGKPELRLVAKTLLFDGSNHGSLAPRHLDPVCRRHRLQLPYVQHIVGGVGCRVKGVGCRCRVWGVGLRLQGVGCGV